MGLPERQGVKVALRAGLLSEPFGRRRNPRRGRVRGPLEDEACRTVPGQIVVGPGHQHYGSVPEPYKEDEVHAQPGQPTECPGQRDATWELSHCVAPSKDGSLPSTGSWADDLCSPAGAGQFSVMSAP